MYGLLLILIARILIKVSHLYKDFVASYWACGNLFVFFFFGQNVIDITSFLNLLGPVWYVCLNNSFQFFFKNPCE